MGLRRHGDRLWHQPALGNRPHSSAATSDRVAAWATWKLLPACHMTVQRISRRYGDDVRNLNLWQRVVLVVALGAVCVAVDGFAAPRSSGWFGYAPNTGVVFDPDAGGKLKVLGLRLALTLAWATSSFFLLRSPK